MVELVREQASERAASTDIPMTLLDICCGEATTRAPWGAVPGVVTYGFDLGQRDGASAAKCGDATYFVAKYERISPWPMVPSIW